MGNTLVEEIQMLVERARKAEALLDEAQGTLLAIKSRWTAGIVETAGYDRELLDNAERFIIAARNTSRGSSQDTPEPTNDQR